MKPILALALAGFAMPAIAQTAPQTTPVAATDPNAPDPVGGYSTPPQPPAPPGTIIQPGPTPTEAFPPPPPLPDYPYCKRGQFDNCKQRNDPK